MMTKGEQPMIGLTWGHKRAIDPLMAASAAYTDRTGRQNVDWQVRDLGRFEHEPLQIVARNYDLLVFDHPFCGVIAASGCFQPLPEDWVFKTFGPNPGDAFIGRSLVSYFYDGQLWGLPVDGACNHAVFRPDLLERIGAVPQNWDAVIDLGQRARREGLWLAMGAKGHHGLLAAAALMANSGHAYPEGKRTDFDLDKGALVSSIDAIRALLDLCPPDSLDWNSIGVQDAMVARDDLVYCPIVYGFATYGEARGMHKLGFGPLPGTSMPFHSGGVLGGAAIGISANCGDFEGALAYLAHLARSDVQSDIFGAHAGQPGRIESWLNSRLNTRFNDYFSGIFDTMQSCSMRPRFVGYQQFEKRAGDQMEHLLRRGAATADIAAAILAEAERVRAGDLLQPYLDLMEPQ